MRPEEAVQAIRGQFPVSTWLSVNQVQSFFGRMAAAKTVSHAISDDDVNETIADMNVQADRDARDEILDTL